MKKIALIMDDEPRTFTITRVAAIMRRIQESNEEVNVYIFRSSGASTVDEDYNLGEYNIYHLPDLSDFDGIIVELNNLRKNDNMVSGVNAFDYVVDKIRKSGKPCISIANDISDFYFVGIDNYSSMKKIIAHLHEVHECKKYWFIMSAKGNFENQNRTKAVRDYMDEHHIAYTEDDFYFEDFEYHCGIHGFHTLLERHNGQLPEVIMCANDNIAIGCCEAAQRLGYRIPADVKVTGFDNYDKASIYTPQITTIDQMKAASGTRSAEIMLRIWNGEDVPRINYTETASLFRGSCGCHACHDEAMAHYIRELVQNDVTYTEYSEQMQALSLELVHCPSIFDICRLAVERISVIKDISLYLVLDTHICEPEHLSELQEHLHSEQIPLLVKGYPPSMRMVFAYENRRILDISTRNITQLFPTFECETPGTDCTFFPLHFGKFTAGYFVVKNGVYLMERRYLTTVISTLCNAIENFQLKDQLKYANEMLSRLYVRDSMTGLFNRLGYQKKAIDLFNHQKSIGENLTILFIDMDRLKYINDNFGHEYGDFAIKIISSAIFHICTEESVPIRWGGDEFLVIMPYVKPNELEKLKKHLCDEIEENARKMQLPCTLTVSIGSVNTDITSQLSLDEYVKNADANMYAEKTSKKASLQNNQR